MNAKEYYCYGFLEKYGYNINGKITKKQFDNCLRREKLYDAANVEIYPENTSQVDSVFLIKSSTDFLIILAPLRKCRNCLEYQAFPAFCVSEDTPHIMAYRSLIWRSKVVKP